VRGVVTQQAADRTLGVREVRNLVRVHTVRPEGGLGPYQLLPVNRLR